jgi:hypothetical protein
MKTCPTCKKAVLLVCVACALFGHAEEPHAPEQLPNGSRVQITSTLGCTTSTAFRLAADCGRYLVSRNDCGFTFATGTST